MMSDYTPITGQHARELLAAARGWSWEVRDIAWEVRQVEDLWFATLDAEVGPLLVHWDGHYGRLSEWRAQMALAAGAPDLAATVAWLYGREPDLADAWDGLLQVSVTPYGEVALYDNEATTTYLTPDEAVDLARALLAAAEEVRDE